MQKLEKTIEKINLYSKLETILAIVFLVFSITTLYNLILDNKISSMICIVLVIISFVALLCTNTDKKIIKLKDNFAELQLVDWDYRYLIPSGTTFLRGPQNQYARIILITIMPDCNVKTISIEEEVFNKIFVEK